MLLTSSAALNPHSLLILMLGEVAWKLLAAVLLLSGALDGEG